MSGTRNGIGGVAGWLVERLRRTEAVRPRLAVLDRVTLCPKQSLALVEAEGQRILVATSAEGGPAFYPLDGEWRETRIITTPRRIASRGPALRPPRISW